MRKKLAVVALAGGVGLTGGLLLTPAAASAATGTSTGIGGRLTALENALKGLVADKTITQDQANAVAKTLADKLPRRGPGHPGRFGGPREGGVHLRPQDVATALGISLDELRTQTRAGKTLTQIAAGKGLSKQALVDKLVAAAKADIAADVRAGRLTQARADAISKNLATRISKRVDAVRMGPRGPHGPDGDRDGAQPPTGGTAAPSSYRTA